MKSNAQYKQTEIGEIPEDWELVLSSEFCVKVTDGTHDSPKRTTDGKYLITSKHITSGIIDLDNAYTISETDFQEINKRSGVNKWDILLSMIGTVGEIALVNEDEINFAIKNIGLFKNGTESKAKWLYYYLQSPTARQYMRSHSSGSTQQYLTLESLRKFPIIIAPNNESEKIVEILSSLDDKIELNRQMNKTLEELGKALFKRWFVDFEFPNENGEPYKSSGGEMVESELGEIPKGWKLKSLPEVADIQKGLSYKGKDLSESSDTALVGLKCIERGGGFRKDGFKFYVGDYKDEHTLKPGDLVVAMTDLTQAADVIGKPAIVPIIPQIETLVASLDLSIIKPKSDGFNEYYLYLLLSRQESQDFLFGYTNGSTVLHLSIKGLKEFKLLVPEEPILVKFQKILQPIREKIKSLDVETSYLPSLRDSLLPRLMSGRIRV